MAEYTIDIRHLLQRGFHLALDTYPIWSEDYRNILNQKIIDHYMFREIGQETPDRFNFFLSRKMNEIMPYYNQMYESQLIEFDPMATEYFRQGTDITRHKDDENISRFKDKHSETNGEVFSKNIDETQDTGFEHKTSETGTGNYGKSGDSEDNKTINRAEELREKTTSENTETTDMNVKGTSKTVNDGTSSTTSSQNTTFSDIPQAGIETTRVIAPDGTITETTKGYATTTTNVAGSSKTTTHNQEDVNTNTDTTGTVENDGSGTKNNDNQIDTTEKDTGVWSEQGKNTNTTTTDTTESTGTKGNTKEDYERNIATERKNTGDKKENTRSDEKTNEMLTSKGRRGQVPAELIMKYRESFINVDMMIIDELETLFMGVF